MEQFKTFRELMESKKLSKNQDLEKETLDVNESAVGERGRTGEKDAEAYITDEKIAEFSKLVKKLGGKTVARLLLNKLNANGDKLKDSGDETLDDIEGMDIKNVNESKNIEAKYVSVMNTLRDLVKTVDSENFDSTDLRKLTRKFEMDLLNAVKNFKS